MGAEQSQDQQNLDRGLKVRSNNLFNRDILLIIKQGMVICNRDFSCGGCMDVDN